MGCAAGREPARPETRARKMRACLRRRGRLRAGLAPFPLLCCPRPVPPCSVARGITTHTLYRSRQAGGAPRPQARRGGCTLCLRARAPSRVFLAPHEWGRAGRSVRLAAMAAGRCRGGARRFGLPRRDDHPVCISSSLPCSPQAPRRSSAAAPGGAGPVVGGRPIDATASAAPPCPCLSKGRARRWTLQPACCLKCSWLRSTDIEFFFSVHNL